MSVAFTDLLIELSRPSLRTKFMRDPKSYLQGREIPDDQIEALLKGDASRFLSLAQSTESYDQDQQFSRHAAQGDRAAFHIIEPFTDLLHVEHQVEGLVKDMTAMIGTPLVIDEERRIYQVVEE